ncbi:Coatomer subunit beta' [Manis javanica]|nr:Coatomer subunit beta' [Manis javanica]
MVFSKGQPHRGPLRQEREGLPCYPGPGLVLSHPNCVPPHPRLLHRCESNWICTAGHSRCPYSTVAVHVQNIHAWA